MSASVERLPTLGIGASLSLSAEPDPVAVVNAQGGAQFIEYAGLVDVEWVMKEVSRVKHTGTPVLYHPSYINFCGSFKNSRHWLKATAEHIKTVDSAWFAQDCAYCFWGEGYSYSSQFGYFIPPIFNAASLKRSIDRVKEVQAAVPVQVALEPPPMSFVIGDMEMMRFFGELVETTDTAILLDMGHLVSYEMASGRRILDELNYLPCERVVEVHIAGGRLKSGQNGPIYVDAHESKVLPQTWQMLQALLPKLPNVKALCFECEGVDMPTVLDTLHQLRDLVHQHSISEGLLATI